jgi:hypothetical protein
LNPVEAAKAQKRAREQQHAAYSDALCRENLIAAQKSAKAAKMAAWAALAAAAGVIIQLIVAIAKYARDANPLGKVCLLHNSGIFPCSREAKSHPPA